MANQEHVAALRKGAAFWNRWRIRRKVFQADLSFLDFESLPELKSMVLDLSDFNFDGCDLRSSSLRNSISSGVSFEGAYLVGADFCFSYFGESNFRNAKIRLSRLGSAEFSYCDFTGADLAYCSAQETKFSGSTLEDVDLRHTQLVASDFGDASLQRALVYGISAWDLKLDGCRQSDLVVTPTPSQAITVDDLELAQFIYLLLSNSRLRGVLDTITSKVVLILGRFSPKRKAVLDALRSALRSFDLVPVLFDFEKPSSRTFIETAVTLAHMARFVVADFTSEGDVRREVQQIAAALQTVPIVPLLHSSHRGIPLTLQDLANHPCILPVVRYRNKRGLVASLQDRVIRPAFSLASKLHAPRSVD